MNWELIAILLFALAVLIYVLKHLRVVIQWMKQEFDDW